MLRFVLFFVLLVFSKIETAKSLQCYRCGNCKDPINTDNLSAETCGYLPKLISVNESIKPNNITIKINEELTARSSVNSGYGCLKLTFKDYGAAEYTTVRRCTAKTIYGQTACDFSQDFIESMNGDYDSCSVCDENLCNSANKYFGPIISSLVMVAGCLYFLY